MFRGYYPHFVEISTSCGYYLHFLEISMSCGYYPHFVDTIHIFLIMRYIAHNVRHVPQNLFLLRILFLVAL